MYSPFTLFADACIADAQQKRVFASLVSSYVSEGNNAAALRDVLIGWKNNHEEFMKLKGNPKLKQLQPMSENLATVAELLLNSMEAKSKNEDQIKALEEAIIKLNTNELDVEVAIIDSLKELITHLKNKEYSDPKIILEEIQ